MVLIFQRKSFVPKDVLQGKVYKKIIYTIMVSLKMATTFVMHAMTLAIGAVVVAVTLVAVVMVVAVNHFPALHLIMSNVSFSF
jgi:hypothetical protein